MTRPLILIAASGLAREVLAALEGSSEYQAVGILDDDRELVGQLVGGVAVLGPLEVVTDYPEAMLLICVGRGVARARVRRRLVDLGIDDQRFATVVDPTVRIPSSARVDLGTIVLAGVVLTADVQLGQHVVVMPHVTLTHDDQLADYVTVCAGVTLGGSVRVGYGAYLGMNASVREGVDVAHHAVLGMGAVLLGDLPAHETWAGVPARRLCEIAEPRLLTNHEIESRTA
jgi:sugar O-acyltransferase (sialic acid O-acetyltransferase NeuD family)